MTRQHSLDHADCRYTDRLRIIHFCGRSFILRASHWAGAIEGVEEEWMSCTALMGDKKPVGGATALPLFELSKNVVCAALPSKDAR